MAISASDVKDLREKTGAGMMDCKKALAECNGDMEAAVDWLRKKGLSAAAKKSDRVAAEGTVAVNNQGTEGVLLEVNAETDFVARNEQFQSYVKQVIQNVYTTGADIEALKSSKVGSDTVAEALTNLIATIGENMTIRRAAHLKVSEGVVSSYVHNAMGDNMGRIGVLVALKTSGDKAKAEEVGRKIAMHIAASAPLALREEEISADVVEKERAFAMEKARESGRPENVLEKMVDGHVRKFLAESVLLNQPFVMEPKKTVAEYIADAAKEIGAATEVEAFTCFRLGEGLEKKEDNFAAEVAAMSK